MVPSKNYLRMKDNTWMVVVEIPHHLRKRARQARFKKSLGTDSLAEANRLKLPWVAEYLRRLAELKAGVSDPRAALMQEALEFNNAYELASPEEQTVEPQKDRRFTFIEREEILSTIKERAKAIAEQYGDETGKTFLGVAEGTATPLANLFEGWLAEFQGAEQTRNQHRASVLEYIGWAGAQISVEATDRRKAGEYIAHRIKTSGLSRRTIERQKSSLSSLWKWLISRGHAQSNPWTGHAVARKSSRPMRRGLEEDTLLKLLKTSYGSDKYVTVLPDLLRLALLTGARLSDLCDLRISDVKKKPDGYWLSIERGKTEAAARDIPLHKAGEKIIARRLRTSTDGYLFSGIKPGGPDNKRSWYVSKAYRRFRDEAGVSGRGEDFHALRHTFIEMMEGAEAAESTVKLLVGHKRSSMTYGHYSKGQRVNLRKVIELLDYGPMVMKALRR
jgi:integrase